MLLMTPKKEQKKLTDSLWSFEGRRCTDPWIRTTDSTGTFASLSRMAELFEVFLFANSCVVPYESFKVKKEREFDILLIKCKIGYSATE